MRKEIYQKEWYQCFYLAYTHKQVLVGGSVQLHGHCFMTRWYCFLGMTWYYSWTYHGTVHGHVMVLFMGMSWYCA
jgi:hypothetical protein